MALRGRSLKQVGVDCTHMEVVPLALELGRGVDLVGHDASDGLQGHVSELRMFHLEERRNCSHVTLIVFGNSER